MDTEEEEAHHVPNVDSSVQLEDTPVSTATVSELENRNSESNFELESVSVLDEPGVSTEVSAEKEEEGEGKGVVGEAGAGEKGGEDLIGGEEKCEMLGGGVEVNASSSGVGNKEGDGGEDGYMAGGKADVVEDAAGVVVMCKMEDASEMANEIRSAGGIEVSVAEHGAVELADEAGNLVERKVADDVLERVDVPEEKQVADMVEERGIADAAAVDGATEGVLAKEEETSVAVEVGGSTEQTVVKEETEIMNEREVADVSVKSEMMVEKEGEQSGVMEETGVDDMTEKTEFVEEPVVEGEMGTDMVEEGGVLEEKSVLNVTEQTEDLEYVHAAREIGNDMAEPAEDSVMEEESEKEEDTELGNEVEGVEKEEEREAEMGDTVEAMEAADDTEMPETTEELEMEAAEETEDTEEIEEDSKASGGKRKRGKKLSTKVPARAPSRKKVEEDVCFICFDGGNLVLCDRRGCPKAYHSACVGRDEAFFQSKGKWNCVELAGVGFSEGTGSSVFSFAQHTVKVLHAPQIGLMALERTIEV